MILLLKGSRDEEVVVKVHEAPVAGEDLGTEDRRGPRAPQGPASMPKRSPAPNGPWEALRPRSSRRLRPCTGSGKKEEGEKGVNETTNAKVLDTLQGNVHQASSSSLRKFDGSFRIPQSLRINIIKFCRP